MKIVYMGTPEFAVAPLIKLAETNHEILMVVSQPDKAKGRSKSLVATPVKEAAIKIGAEVFQPEKIKSDEAYEVLSKLEADIFVVCAYGQILPERILNLPKLGCVNIHASLLPKYRGAAPIERGIIDGDKEAGVTIMYMEKGLDTGDMISSVSCPIEDNDDAESLRAKLSDLGAKLMVDTLPSLEDGTAVRTPQNDEESTYASMLTKELGLVDFNKSAAEIERLIRGLIQWPNAYTYLDGKQMKFFGGVVVPVEDGDEKSSFAPGEICEVTKKFFTVRCGVDALRITKLQPEGKKVMDTVAFLNGCKLAVGTKLG